MMLFALLSHTERSYAWWSISAGIMAWLASYVLVRRGDRGIGTGVAMAAGIGVAVAIAVIMLSAWHGHWVLW
jgi:hypothetical protein